MARLNANPTPRPSRSRTVSDDEVADDLAALDEGFGSDPASPGTALLLGAGVKLNVISGHLHAHDGEGWFRRDRRWNRATNRLSRLVVAADSGYFTLDALKWCQAAGVELVITDGEGGPIFAPAGGTMDPRIIRVQAAPSPELAVEAARLLLRPKLAGQAKVAREMLDAPVVADTIDALAADLDTVAEVDEARQREASSAAVYFDAWTRHPATTLRFARSDIDSVPEHWPIFEGRRSVIGGTNTPRRADRPLGALLNLAYHFAVVEARLAATTVGLLPGLGIIHADQVSKPALAFDLVEPVRPAVDQFILEPGGRADIHTGEISSSASTAASASPLVWSRS